MFVRPDWTLLATALGESARRAMTSADGSWLSIGSLASDQSMFSAPSHQCRWSLLSFPSQRSLLSSRSQR